jgi:vancomycin resistance protein VanW
VQRAASDLLSGHLFSRASLGDSIVPFPYRITVEQPIRESPTRANKVANLRLAATRIEALQINPGEHFSFWGAVGAPTRRRGYRLGRSLAKGQLVEKAGGGLCQLSGLIYLLGLLAGLEVGERHAHSLDIYREEERFAPLGADSTVVFGYKDLRLVNPHPCPVRLRFEISDEMIRGTLESPEPIRRRAITFKREMRESQILVTTWIDNEPWPRATSRYQPLPAL